MYDVHTAVDNDARKALKGVLGAVQERQKMVFVNVTLA